MTDLMRRMYDHYIRIQIESQPKTVGEAMQLSWTCFKTSWTRKWAMFCKTYSPITPSRVSVWASAPG